LITNPSFSTVVSPTRRSPLRPAPTGAIITEYSLRRSAEASIEPTPQTLALVLFPLGQTIGSVLVPAIAESDLDQPGEIGRAQRLGLHGGVRVVADAVEGKTGEGLTDPSLSSISRKSRDWMVELRGFELMAIATCTRL
jgi:hypothetical protein